MWTVWLFSRNILFLGTKISYPMKVRQNIILILIIFLTIKSVQTILSPILRPYRNRLWPDRWPLLNTAYGRCEVGLPFWALIHRNMLQDVRVLCLWGGRHFWIRWLVDLAHWACGVDELITLSQLDCGRGKPNPEVVGCVTTPPPGWLFQKPKTSHKMCWQQECRMERLVVRGRG